MLRYFNRVAFCCRSIDFFSLMAAMTLLLAHIEGHRRCTARSPQQADAATGNVLRADGVSVQVPDADDQPAEELQDDDSAVRMYIPYIGIIKIAHEGVVS